jgi:GntR family transcriptional regulator/MocR family aminotransferase
VEAVSLVAGGNKRPLSPRGQQLQQDEAAFGKTAVAYPAFVTGVPALDQFPFDLWGRLVSKQYRQHPRELFGEVGHGSAGYLPLRQAIATYLQAARGVGCEPEQVLIVNGSQQGLYLAAHVLLEPGAQVWVEEPGYLGARAALGSTGATLVPVPVGAEGICVAQGMELAPAARCAYVTPSHQFPLGSTMSLANRIALLNWAEENGAWIIEDDYDSEYRYGGQPLPSLQGLDQNGRVIYVGTFSKVLFPSLRLGYLVVPPDLVTPLARLRALVDSHSPTAVQGAMAEFIAKGHFVRHIRRMRQLYGARRAHFAAAVGQALGDLLQLNETEAGMHVVGWLPDGVDDRAVVVAAQRRQVTVKALSSHFLGVCLRPGLVLGVMGVEETAVVPALIRLRQAIESTL